MQTKYEIWIYRKQLLLQPILYINEFIHSYWLQNKYVRIEIFLEVYFLQHTFLNWQKTQYRCKKRWSIAFTYIIPLCMKT